MYNDDMKEVGRPTELNEELFTKIKGLVLEHYNMKEIASTLEIPYSTMANWVSTNYRNFGDIYLSYEQERKLRKATLKIETLIDSEDERVALNASTFIAETLGKDKGYSKRTELTGKDGKEFEIKTIVINKA